MMTYSRVHVSENKSFQLYNSEPTQFWFRTFQISDYF